MTAKYKLTQGTTILRTEDNAFIPADPGNSDYRNYLAWIEDGNIPEPHVEPPAPPVTQVTAYQAKIALLQANLYSQANSTVYASNNQQMVIAWEYATRFYRDSPFILNMQPALGLSNTQVDELFLAASKIY